MSNQPLVHTISDGDLDLLTASSWRPLTRMRAHRMIMCPGLPGGWIYAQRASAEDHRRGHAISPEGSAGPLRQAMDGGSNTRMATRALRMDVHAGRPSSHHAQPSGTPGQFEARTYWRERSRVRIERRYRPDSVTPREEKPIGHNTATDEAARFKSRLRTSRRAARKARKPAAMASDPRQLYLFDFLFSQFMNATPTCVRKTRTAGAPGMEIARVFFSRSRGRA